MVNRIRLRRLASFSPRTIVAIKSALEFDGIHEKSRLVSCCRRKKSGTKPQRRAPRSRACDDCNLEKERHHPAEKLHGRNQEVGDSVPPGCNEEITRVPCPARSYDPTIAPP